jgi:hypothetical protein
VEVIDRVFNCIIVCNEINEPGQGSLYANMYTEAEILLIVHNRCRADELVNFRITFSAQFGDAGLGFLNSLSCPVSYTPTDIPHSLEPSHLVLYGRFTDQKIRLMCT